MKNIIIAAAMAMLSCSVSYAQDVTKQVVNVGNFSYASDFRADEAGIIRNNVIQSLQATKRVIVVDLNQQDAIKQEAERRKSEAAMGDNRDIEDITQLNADFILTGVLKSITETQGQQKSWDGKTYTAWKANIEFTINLIDPATGATTNSYSYTSSASSTSNSEEARTNAINSCSGNLKRFIEEAFPVRGKILQMAEGDNKKAKTVYINLGNDQGIQKGQKFIVYEVVDIAGEKSEKEIGTLTVNEVMSATRSLCKVNDGGQEISANLSAGKEMTLKSRATKTLFGI